MARKSMRDKIKGKLTDRTKESHSRRDDSGSIKNFFDSDKMEGVQTWWAGKGDHIIDIIPYFAGKNDPRNKEGEPAYVLDIDVHRNVGPMEEQVVCLEQFGKPCPICEEARKLGRANADWKTVIKPLKPGRRALYNIIVRDGGDIEKKGVQVLEIAHWFMERHLAKIAKDPRGGGFTVFSDPDDGKSISFERTGVGMENTGYSGHRFVDRPDVISDEELEAAFCLDDLIEMKDYDTIYAMFHGEEEAAPPEEEADVPDTTDEGESEDDNEPEPEKTKRGKRGKRGKKAPTCPHGGTIGDDIDELDECDDCDVYDSCEEIADAE